MKTNAVDTEYAFLFALIAIFATIGMTVLGENLQEFFQTVGSALQGGANKLPDTFGH